MKKLGIAAALAASLLGGTALAQTSAPSEATRICTGGTSGVYYKAGVAIKEQVGKRFNLEVVSTNGSWDNLERLDKNDCQIAVVQGDAFELFKKKNPTSRLDLEKVGSLYKEYPHLICRRDIDVSRVTKLKAEHVVMVGPVGSGSAITWENLVLADKGLYGKIATLPIGGTRAINKLRDGSEAKCFFGVYGLGSEAMKTLAENSLDERSKPMFVLVDFDDSDLFKKVKDSKGRPLYERGNIPSRSYQNIQDGSVDTVAIAATVVVRTDWMDKNPKESDVLGSAVLKAIRVLAADMKSK